MLPYYYVRPILIINILIMINVYELRTCNTLLVTYAYV